MPEQRKDYMNLDKLYDSIDDMKEGQARIETKVEALKESVDHHNRLILGNGSDGCIAKLTNNALSINELIESVKRRFTGVYWLLALAVTVTIAAFEIMWRYVK